MLIKPLHEIIRGYVTLCISSIKAVAEYYRKREGSEGRSYIPEYEEMQISDGDKVKVDMENGGGLGWELSITKKEVCVLSCSVAKYMSIACVYDLV